MYFRPLDASRDIQLRNERAQIVLALLDRAKTAPERLVADDDGTRSGELELAIAELQQAADELSDPSARAGLSAALRGDARVAEGWFLLRARAKANGSAENRREAAMLYRRRAALASVHDRARTAEALHIATTLAPDNPALWVRLGHALPDLEAAERAYRLAIKLSTELLAQKADATLLRDLAIAQSNLALHMSRPDEAVDAERLHRRALEIFEQLGDRNDLARHLTRVGWFYRASSLKLEHGNAGVRLFWTRREQSTAAGYFARALKLYTELGDDERVAELVGFQGMLANDQDQFKQAEDLYRRALALAERCGAREIARAQLTGLGAVYSHVGRYDDSKAFFARANTEGEHRPNLFPVDQRLVRGAQLLHAGDHESAFECFESARVVYDGYGYSEGLGRSLAGLGMVAARRGELNEAKSYWEKARLHFVDVGMADEAAELDDLIANC